MVGSITYGGDITHEDIHGKLIFPNSSEVEDLLSHIPDFDSDAGLDLRMHNAFAHFIPYDPTPLGVLREFRDLSQYDAGFHKLAISRIFGVTDKDPKEIHVHPEIEKRYLDIERSEK